MYIYLFVCSLIPMNTIQSTLITINPYLPWLFQRLPTSSNALRTWLFSLMSINFPNLGSRLQTLELFAINNQKWELNR